MSTKISLTFIALLLGVSVSSGQEYTRLLFGTVKQAGAVEQSRFEVLEKGNDWQITYAPYGMAPIKFTDVRKADRAISFKWTRNDKVFNCNLKLIPDSIVHYKGIGLCGIDTIQIIMRRSNAEDAQLQGNFLVATETDLSILDKALDLLQDGRNWNRQDSRICEGTTLSLFCALYQGSIAVGGEYKHLSPAMRMVRDAITAKNPGRQYNHILQDFNNEARAFEDIKSALNTAKVLLQQEIDQQHKDADTYTGWRKYHILAINARTAGRWESAAAYFLKSAELKGRYNTEDLFDASIMNARCYKIDAAFNVLNMAVNAGMFDVKRANLQRRLAPLRDDPRWKGIIEKMSKRRPLEKFYWHAGTLQTAKINPVPVVDLTAKIESGMMENVHSFLMAKDGKLIYEKYFNGWGMHDQHETRSAQKSITALLVGIAIDKGFIKNVNDPVLNYFPDYKPSKNWDERKRKMTVYHFLTMTSGLGTQYSDEGVLQNQKENKDWVTYMLDAPLVYNPGETCEYSSSAMNVLNGVIENASGMLLDEFADKFLFSPLEIFNKALAYDPSGRMYGAGGAELLPRDMLKLGQLLVNNGKWNGKQLISKDFLTQLETKHSKVYPEQIDYGYLWHIVDLKTKSGIKITSYGAYGNGGQFIIAVPKMNIVAVFTAGNFGKANMGDTIQYFEKIILQNIDF